MFAQGVNEDVGEGDVTAASPGPWRLKADAIGPGVFQRFTDLKYFSGQRGALHSQCVFRVEDFINKLVSTDIFLPLDF